VPIESSGISPLVPMEAQSSEDRTSKRRIESPATKNKSMKRARPNSATSTKKKLNDSKNSRRDLHSSSGQLQMLLDSLPVGTTVCPSWDEDAIIASSPGHSVALSLLEQDKHASPLPLFGSSPKETKVTFALCVKILRPGAKTKKLNGNSSIVHVGTTLGRAIFGQKNVSTGSKLVLEGLDSGQVRCKRYVQRKSSDSDMILDGSPARVVFDVGEPVVYIAHLTFGGGCNRESMIVISQSGKVQVVASNGTTVEHDQWRLPLSSRGKIESCCQIGRKILFSSSESLYSLHFLSDNDRKNRQRESNDPKEIEKVRPLSARFITVEPFDFPVSRVCRIIYRGNQDPTKEKFIIITTCGRIYLSLVSELTSDPHIIVSRRLRFTQRRRESLQDSKPGTVTALGESRDISGIAQVLDSLSDLSKEAKDLHSKRMYWNSYLSTLSGAIHLAKVSQLRHRIRISANCKRATELKSASLDEGELVRINPKVIWSDKRPEKLVVHVKLKADVIPNQGKSACLCRLVCDIFTSKKRKIRISQPITPQQSRHPSGWINMTTEEIQSSFSTNLDGVLCPTRIVISIAYDLAHLEEAKRMYDGSESPFVQHMQDDPSQILSEITLGEISINALDMFEILPSFPVPAERVTVSSRPQLHSCVPDLRPLEAVEFKHKMRYLRSNEEGLSVSGTSGFKLSTFLPLMNDKRLTKVGTVSAERTGGETLKNHICARILEILVHGGFESTVGLIARQARCTLRVGTGIVTASCLLAIKEAKMENVAEVRVSKKADESFLVIEVLLRGGSIDPEILVALHASILQRYLGYAKARITSGGDILNPSTKELPSRDPEWATTWHNQVFRKLLPEKLENLKKLAPSIRELKDRIKRDSSRAVYRGRKGDLIHSEKVTSLRKQFAKLILDMYSDSHTIVF